MIRIFLNDCPEVAKTFTAGSPVLKPVAKTVRAQKSNVVHLKPSKIKTNKSAFSSESNNQKMASGDDSSTPSRDDDGFNDT